MNDSIPKRQGCVRHGVIGRNKSVVQGHVRVSAARRPTGVRKTTLSLRSLTVQEYRYMLQQPSSYLGSCAYAGWCIPYPINKFSDTIHNDGQQCFIAINAVSSHMRQDCRMRQPSEQHTVTDVP